MSSPGVRHGIGAHAVEPVAGLVSNTQLGPQKVRPREALPEARWPGPPSPQTVLPLPRTARGGPKPTSPPSEHPSRLLFTNYGFPPAALQQWTSLARIPGAGPREREPLAWETRVATLTSYYACRRCNRLRTFRMLAKAAATNSGMLGCSLPRSLEANILMGR